MRLTTRGRYAVTAMLDLALHRDEGPIALAGFSFGAYVTSHVLADLWDERPTEHAVLVGTAASRFVVPPVPAGPSMSANAPSAIRPRSTMRSSQPSGRSCSD